MSNLRSNTAVRFGDAATLDSKAFTFVMEPQSHVATSQDSEAHNELRSSNKRHPGFDETTMPNLKRYKSFASPSDQDTDHEAGCPTPYPAPKSEPGSASDDSDVEVCDSESFMRATAKEYVELLVASIKRKVKDECEVALDTAWKEVVNY